MACLRSVPSADASFRRSHINRYHGELGVVAVRPSATRRTRRRVCSYGSLHIVAVVLLVGFAAPAPANMPVTTVGATPGASTSEPRLNTVFRAAAEEFDVPRDLLLAVAYTETRLDDHGGEPSVDGGYGLMHLVDNPVTDTLRRARVLTGVPEAKLQESRWQNVRGGAALLRDVADRLGLRRADRGELRAWYPAVARYSNAVDDSVAKMYADEVFRLLRSGLRTRTPDGELVVLRPADLDRWRPFVAARGATATPSPDYPGASWVPAYTGNYSNYSRGRNDVKYIVLHTTQGSYAGAISWFQNPSANVSAHYVIRSSDGRVTQTVREEDVAWHAGNWTYNLQSIGIEHEGWVNQAGWYTDNMYRSSAMLVRRLAEKYSIPLDRKHILGHRDVPGATHTDPGPKWDWDYFMGLVRAGKPAPWSSVIDNGDPQFDANPVWGTSRWSPQRYGSDYSYANPSPDAGDVVWYRFAIPADGKYAVSIRYPSNAGYNPQTRVKVRTSEGTRFYAVDQRADGGQWVDLGDVPLDAGDRRVVGVSRRSPAAGYVVADAVRLEQR